MALNVIERPCKLPPLKFNMELENGWFPKGIFFSMGWFSDSMNNCFLGDSR